MKFIYSVILIISTFLSRVNSLPIINKYQHIDTDPAIVVTRPNKQTNNILFNPVNETDPILFENEPAIVPPPPPPAPPGPILMPAKFILPDGTIIYTPKDISPFIISEFSDLEPIEIE